MARGAYESGVLFAAGYPGTPSSEILEEIAKYKGIDAYWMSNEKVALDSAVGASLAGVRSLAAMKHVGLNVAIDTLMTLSYTGVNAGLVVITADDPGLNSSQNEQDSRNYAKFTRIPLLEPSDSQEAKDFIKNALYISEKFDTPVLIKTTARIAHSKSIVQIKNKTGFLRKVFMRNPDKYVMIPDNARKRRVFVENRLRKLQEFSEETLCNRIEWGKDDIGIITAGVSYQYAKEACPQASFLKLGMSYPLPENLIKKFSKKVDMLYVIEELDPFIEEQVKAMGIKVKGKELFPLTGELTTDLVTDKLFNRASKKIFLAPDGLSAIAPSLCAGCSYRSLFYSLKKLGLVVIGDIGCYTLGVLPPLSSMDTCISMGSSIGMAFGFKKSAKACLKKKIAAVIGDSTFLHSGISALVSLVYNNGANIIIILDNQTTAMTGGQDHPGTGFTLKKERTCKIDYKRLVKAIGVNRVRVIDSYDLNESEKVIKKEIACDELSVIIARNPCLLMTGRKKTDKSFRVSLARCINCKKCLKTGCPAIAVGSDKKVHINSDTCAGCSLCKQICPVNAIEENVYE